MHCYWYFSIDTEGTQNRLARLVPFTASTALFTLFFFSVSNALLYQLIYLFQFMLDGQKLNESELQAVRDGPLCSTLSINEHVSLDVSELSKLK